MTNHANELRLHARKIPHPQGETPGVMLRAADEIDRLRARIERMEKQGPVAVDINAFRSAFEAALKERNWPATRQGDGYLSPSTQSAWRIAFSTVRRLQLYLAPGAKGEGSHERTE